MNFLVNGYFGGHAALKIEAQKAKNDRRQIAMVSRCVFGVWSLKNGIKERLSKAFNNGTQFTLGYK